MAKPVVHTCRKGETLGKIAKKYGAKDWKYIYNDPANAKFRKTRPDPNKIEPGDKIVIPPTKAMVEGKYSKDMPRMSISINADKALIFV